MLRTNCFALFTSLLIMGGTLFISAQNLVNNGNFESFSSCPDDDSQITRAINWYNANVSGVNYPSCDYYNCGLMFVENPYPAPSGSGAAGMNYASSQQTSAEMLGTFVTLTSGVSYTFSIKMSLGFSINSVNLPDYKVMVGNTSSFPVATSNNPRSYCPIGFTQVVSISGAQMATLDTGSYTTFSFTFVAPANTNAMILGGVCASSANLYVFVDDVSITSSCTPSSSPSSASSTVNCPGGSYNLSVIGGQLGTGASWKWYRGSCPGTLVGTGSTINVTPSSTTTYYVRAEGDCGTTFCRSVTVNIAASTSTHAWNGSINSNWHEPCNWNTNRVPGATSPVSIPGGTPNNPTVNAGQTAYCRTLFINYGNGGAIQVNTNQGAVLQVGI